MGAFDSIFNTSRKIVNNGKQGIQASDFIVNPLLKIKPQAPVFGLPGQAQFGTRVDSKTQTSTPTTSQKGSVEMLKDTAKFAVPLAKEVAQGTARAVGTVGITAGNVALPGQPFQSTINTQNTGIGRALFGNTPVKDLQTYGQSGLDYIDSLRGQKEGSERLNPALATPLGALGIAFELAGMGGTAKNVALGIAKTTDKKVVSKLLATAVPDFKYLEKAQIRAASDLLATVNDPKQVNEYIQFIQKQASKTRVSKIAADMTEEDANILRNMYRELPSGSVEKNIEAEDRIIKAMELDKVPAMQRKEAVEEILTEYDIRWQGVEEMQNPPAKLNRPGAMDIKPNVNTADPKNFKTADEFVKAQGTPVFHGSGSSLTEIKSMRQLRDVGSNVEPSNIGGNSPFVHVTDSEDLAKGYARSRALNIKGTPNVVEATIQGKILDLNTITKQEAQTIEDALQALSGGRGADARITRDRLLEKQVNFSDIEQSKHLESVLRENGYSGIKFRDRGFVGEFKDTVAVLPDKIKTRTQLTDIWNRAQTKQPPKEAFAGGVAGVEQDEEGNATFNPLNAALGIGAAGAAGSLKRVSKFKKGTSDAFQRADFEVTTKLAELSQAGKRIGLQDGSTLAYSSTFPKWVPEHLRSNALFKQTLKHYEAGTVPAKNAVKQTELLDVIQQRVQSEALKYGDVPAPKVRQMSRSKEIPSLEKAALEATNAVSDPFPILKKKAVLSPAEANTLEESAQRQVEVLDLPPEKKPLTLEEIVTQTPLDRKVNIIDYFRTPDRVLKKIGFDKEAQLLRRQYDEYVKELPKNIDTISAWVKQVPKESNERLFRYLDGEDIKLNPTEMKVAGEIKDYLKTWADRLKLPEDNRIASYITHLFDESLLKKEFDEDLAKIISDKIPGQVYDPFLEKRLGAKGYRQDVWAALDAYTKRATRKVHLDPALEKIKDKAGSSLEFSNLEKSQFDYIQNYVNRVNMRPTWIDNMIDTGFKQMFGYSQGQRPVAKVSQALRRATYRGMLGLNLGSALRNLSQGVNTYAVLGEKYTAIGYAKLFSKPNFDELAREGVLAQNFIEDRSISATKKAIEKLDRSVWVFFDTAEKINRGSAYFGAKAKGLASGMNEASAIDYAKKVVRQTQFAYDSVDTPLALSPDILKTFFQFQTYTTKQLEFLGTLVKDKNFAALARYAIGGTAFVYTVGQAVGMELEEILPWYRFETPPSLKFPVEVFKAATDAPDKYGNQRDTERKVQDVTKAGLGLIPGGMQAKKTYEGLNAVEEGGSYDRAGRQQFEVGGTTGKDIQAVLFGKYANKEAKSYFDKKTDTGEKALDKAVKERNQAGKERSVEAKQVFTELKSITSDEERNARLKEVYDTDRQLYNKIMDLRRDEKLNLSDEEKAIKYNLGVEDGTRAKYIYGKYKSFSDPAEGKAYLKNLRDKKIITDEVMKQLNELRQQEKVTS